MSFQEKSAWIMLTFVVLVYGWYFTVVFGDVAAQEAVRDIAYKGLMLVTVVVLTVLAALSHIVIAVASPRDADKTDERDKEINRLGEYAGGYVIGVGALVALGLAMYEVEYFWIANAILAGLVLSEIVSGVTKIVFYRRGF